MSYTFEDFRKEKYGENYIKQEKIRGEFSQLNTQYDNVVAGFRILLGQIKEVRGG